MYRLIFFVLLSNYILAFDINEQVPFNELLSHSQVYIDKTKSATIENIQDKNFKPNNEKILGFGYSPDFNVWIRFTLTNTSQQTIHKIIEYGNPLTSHIAFYEANTGKLLMKDGLLATAKDRKSIHPIFKITLQPNESKTFYIKAYNYFSLLINNVQNSFQKPHITIHLTTDIDLKSDDAVYCGFILNEAMTNSYQHAFKYNSEGKIFISLSKENNVYHLNIKDNGIGYTRENTTDNLGIMIIDTLAKIQLDGEITINASDGVEINITWEDHG